MKVSLRTCPPVTLFGGMAIGAGLMYLLDFERGVSRRARLRTRAMMRLRKLGEMIHERAREFADKLQVAPLQRVAAISLIPRQPVPDWVLAERTRLETWRTLAHPDSVQISVRDGRVTLWGPVLTGEPERLHARLLKIPGVRKVELQFTTRQEATAQVA